MSNNNNNQRSPTADNGGFSIGVSDGTFRRQRSSNRRLSRGGGGGSGGSGTGRRNNHNRAQEADENDNDQALPRPSPFLEATMNIFSQQAATSEGISSLRSNHVVPQQRQPSTMTRNNSDTLPNFFSNTNNGGWSFNLGNENADVEEDENEEEDEEPSGDELEDDDEDDNLDPQVNPFAALDVSEFDDDDDDDEDFYPGEDDEEDYDENSEICPDYLYDSDDDDSGGRAEDVYYDSDGEDDDDDDDFDMPPHEVLEFMMRNYMMGGVDDSDEDGEENDEDDDDESPCDCRVCTCRRFGLGFCIDDYNDDHFDDQNVQVSSSNLQEENNESKKKKKRKNRKRNKTPGASCAICLEEEGNDRRFAFLPCCGSSTTEQTSSLRFCLKCLMKCLVKNGELVPQEGTVPPSTDRQMRMVSECPRCKRLLCLTATKKHDNNGNRQRSRNQQKKNNFNHRIEPATIQELMWYVGKQPNPYYMKVMLFIAYGLPQNVMYPLMKPMSSDPNRLLRNLHQWGLISKQTNSKKSKWARFIPAIRSGKTTTTSGDSSSYTIDPVSQLELRDGLIRHLKMPKESEEITSTYLQEGHIMGRDENTEKQCLMAGACSFNIGWWALRKWNVSLCILTWNRSLTLVLLGVGIFFPPINTWPVKYTRVCWQTMTTFNAFLLYLTCKALVHILYLAMYLLQAYVVSQVVAGRFRKEPVAWKRRSQNVILSGFIIYAAYRTVQFSFRLYEKVETWSDPLGPSNAIPVDDRDGGQDAEL